MILQQLLWVMAATTAGLLPNAARSEAAPPPAHHLVGVPFAERHPNWCGPDALAAVLRFHGAQFTAEEIAREVYLPRSRGSLNLDLLLYARRHGFAVSAESGSAESLRQAVARDRPVICLVRERGLLASSNHYVIVRGYDQRAGVWFVDEGEAREVSRSEQGFEAAWERCNRWMLTVEGRATTEGASAAH